MTYSTTRQLPEMERSTWTGSARRDLSVVDSGGVIFGSQNKTQPFALLSLDKIANDGLKTNNGISPSRQSFNIPACE